MSEPRVPMIPLEDYLRDVVNARFGEPYDELGNYVPSGNRCTPGLGWPIAGQRLPGLYFERYQQLPTGAIVRRAERRDRE